MELQDFGPIAQAGNNMQSNTSKGCLTSALIGFGAGMIVGYMFFAWQQQQSALFNLNKLP